MRLDNGGDFSEVLNARKQQLDRSLATVSVIYWAACQDSGPENSCSQQHGGFVHYCSFDFLKPILNGIVKTRVARESRE